MFWAQTLNGKPRKCWKQTIEQLLYMKLVRDYSHDKYYLLSFGLKLIAMNHQRDCVFHIFPMFRPYAPK